METGTESAGDDVTKKREETVDEGKGCAVLDAM